MVKKNNLQGKVICTCECPDPDDSYFYSYNDHPVDFYSVKQKQDGEEGKASPVFDGEIPEPYY